MCAGEQGRQRGSFSLAWVCCVIWDKPLVLSRLKVRTITPVTTDLPQRVSVPSPAHCPPLPAQHSLQAWLWQ